MDIYKMWGIELYRSITGWHFLWPSFSEWRNTWYCDSHSPLTSASDAPHTQMGDKNIVANGVNRKSVWPPLHLAKISFFSLFFFFVTESQVVRDKYQCKYRGFYLMNFLIKWENSMSCIKWVCSFNVCSRESDVECDKIRGQCLEEIRTQAFTGDAFGLHVEKKWKFCHLL